MRESELHKSYSSKGKKKSKVVGYSFHELPKWFDENPDVMYLCKAYLNELERFVTEVENMIKRE